MKFSTVLHASKIHEKSTCIRNLKTTSAPLFCYRESSSYQILLKWFMKTLFNMYAMSDSAVWRCELGIYAILSIMCCFICLSSFLPYNSYSTHDNRLAQKIINDGSSLLLWTTYRVKLGHLFMNGTKRERVNFGIVISIKYCL